MPQSFAVAEAQSPTAPSQPAPAGQGAEPGAEPGTVIAVSPAGVVLATRDAAVRVADLFDAAGRDLREYLRYLLGIVDLEERQLAGPFHRQSELLLMLAGEPGDPAGAGLAAVGDEAMQQVLKDCLVQRGVATV